MEKRYQVFISSTFQDLQSARQEVSQALLRAHCFPAGMELFPAVDEEQFEVIKSIIDQSDYYILISAGRYGSIHPETGLSYTEMEYDYAVKTGKPVIRLLHSDPFNELKGEFIEKTDEGRSKLAAFRRKLAEKKLVRFWDSPSDLKSEVIFSLLDMQRRVPQPGWIRGNLDYQLEPIASVDSADNLPSPSDVDDLVQRIQNFGDFGVCFKITCFLDDWDEDKKEHDQGIGPVYGYPISGARFLELILGAGSRKFWCQLDDILDDWPEHNLLFASYADFLEICIWEKEFWKGLSKYSFSKVPQKAIKLSSLEYEAEAEAYLVTTLSKQVSEDRYSQAIFIARPVDIMKDKNSSRRALFFLNSLGLINLETPDDIDNSGYRLTVAGEVIARRLEYSPL